jgi:2-keto-4-pentenoate hydratase/2-oxohepta-3-ene-1,7-dioic acid hydratase in catechol pathway
MRLASFKIADRPSWGVVAEDSVIDVGGVLGQDLPDLRAAIGSHAYGEIGRSLTQAPRHRLETVEWLPVVPNPGKIICVGLNYEEHRKETGRSRAGFPAIFTRFASSQAGHLTPVPLSHLSTQLDYEGELAVVVGRRGRYIPARDALAYVAGYSCYNDISVRDWQYHTHQFSPGKNFPGTGAFGPWLVTPDELGPYETLRLETRVNGTVVQSATFEQMIFGVPQLIEYCSSFTQLEPGDVIITGTPGGIGAKRQPPLWLKPGDVTEVAIERIGTLRNTIISERRS